MTASGLLCGKVTLHVVFTSKGLEVVIWSTNSNPIDGLYRNIKDILQFGRYGFDAKP